MMGRTVGFWLIFSAFCCFFEGYQCYETIDYEIFDLVEEVNQTFYQLFDVSQTAATSDIKRAYRKLAVKYHPDKNKVEGAEEFFRQIAAVYDILKDEDKRQRYDLVLEHGLPDWRQPVFYFRRVRKLGLAEIGLLLAIILTLGHLILIWVSYAERRYNAEEVFRSRRKPTKAKGGSKVRQAAAEMKELEMERELESELATIPKPTFWDILPLKLTFSLIALAHFIYEMPSRYREVKLQREEEQRLEQLEQEEEERRIEQLRKLQEASKNKKRVDLVELRSTMISTNAEDPTNHIGKQIEDDEDFTPTKSGLWTDEDLHLLARALTKFPGGVAQRWQKVARMTGRPVKEVTIMSKSLKAEYFRAVDPKNQGITGSLEEVSHTQTLGQYNDVTERSWDDDNDNNDAMISAGDAAVRRRKKGRRNNPIIPTPDTMESQKAVWSQEQQRLLELALSMTPKGTENRWDVIAEAIEGKTKEDCMTRYKYLAEMVKKKKVPTATLR